MHNLQNEHTQDPNEDFFNVCCAVGSIGCWSLFVTGIIICRFCASCFSLGVQ